MEGLDLGDQDLVQARRLTEMSGESLQYGQWSQSRKRPSPALAPEISDNESEDLLCQPRGPKTPKLSKGSEDEPTLDPTHRSLGCRNIQDLGGNAESSSYYSNSSLSPRNQTQPISEASEYDTLLQLNDSKLI